MTNQELFEFIKRLAVMPLEYDPKDPAFRIVSTRLTMPFPDYVQTEGVFFTLKGGAPYSLWTPWGEWFCWRSPTGPWEERVRRMLKRLEVRVDKEAADAISGNHEVVYAILKVEGTSLPEPLLRRREDYLPTDVAIPMWHRLLENSPWGTIDRVHIYPYER